MENSYCGMRCAHCRFRSEGKCYGCKPDIENKYLINISKPEDETGTFDDLTGRENFIPDVPVIFDPENRVVTNADDSGKRYSTYCKIAICCKKNKFDNCGMCNKRVSCYDYSCKGNMSSVIELKLNEWGVTDHGLKASVKYQRLLLICFILLIVPSVASLVEPKFSIIYIPLAGLSMYGYSKLILYSEIFRVTVLLTGGDMLIRFLTDIIDYGSLNMILYMIRFAISIVNYKITFDAYADMVDEADERLEKRWLQFWPLTIALYAICAVILLFTQSAIVMALPSVIMDLVIIAYMLVTIEVCKKN